MIENDEELVIVLEGMASNTSGLSATERQACEMAITAVKILKRILTECLDDKEEKKNE